MDDNQLLDDVHFVRQMIANNRRTLVDNGINYISTGVFMVAGIVITFLLDWMGKASVMPYVWLALMAVLIVFNVVAQHRIGRGRVISTFATQIFAAVWLACGVPIMIVSVMFFVTTAVSLSTMLACVSVCLGIGYYLTGVINDLRFMKFLAAGWWAGVALSLLWSRIGAEYQLGLLFSLLILVLEVVPGIIIYKKWKLAANE